MNSNVIQSEVANLILFAKTIFVVACTTGLVCVPLFAGLAELLRGKRR